MKQETSEKKLRDKERKRFEKWMSAYWGGISLETVATIGSDFEYRHTGAQVGWEVWKKHNKVKR